MLRVRQPKTPVKLIPIIRDEDTKKLLDTCKGKDFVQVRDEAIPLCQDLVRQDIN
jgi:site-specific recombinase XerC